MARNYETNPIILVDLVSRRQFGRALQDNRRRLPDLAGDQLAILKHCFCAFVAEPYQARIGPRSNKVVGFNGSSFKGQPQRDSRVDLGVFNGAIRGPIRFRSCCRISVNDASRCIDSNGLTECSTLVLQRKSTKAHHAWACHDSKPCAPTLVNAGRRFRKEPLKFRESGGCAEQGARQVQRGAEKTLQET